MKNRLKLVALFLLSTYCTSAALAVDTLKVMHYNLLYFGVNTTFCTSTNNNINEKEGWLRTILAHEMPDIFTVNEISNTAAVQQRVLTNVFSQIASKPYARAHCPNLAGSSIVNMLYFNEQKLKLKSQEVLQSSVRDIDLYTLYYNSHELAQGDTVFIHCIVAHLKAGSTSSDQSSRSGMVLNALNYLRTYKQPGNIMFMGDLNLYSSTEPAYQNLLNYFSVNYRFYDPVNQPGNWNGNVTFSNYHTQSTRTTSAGCHSTGGMDDRFDFILISNDIRLRYDRVQYVPGSYRTLGQDGQRLNKSLLDSPFNSSAPFAVLEALFNMSDHLPVLLKLAVDQTPAIGLGRENPLAGIRITNPAISQLTIHFNGIASGLYFEAEIHTLLGAFAAKYSGFTDGGPQHFPIHGLTPGIYVVTFKMQGSHKTFKAIVM